MRNSKYVEDYLIEKFDNEIYLLSFNTTERWLYFHQFNNEMYQIGGNEESNWEEGVIQEIPENILPKSGYLHLPLQEKDQLSFYFIPMNLVFNNGKIIYNSKDV